jgi:hypothetical protein
MLQALPNGLHFIELDTLEPWVGDDFLVQSDPEPLAVRLDKLIKYRNGPGFLPRAPFTALWSTDINVSLLLGTYALRHGSWGPHRVYLEPMHFIGSRRAYQSVFF